METFFIRHTKDLDIDAATRKSLWERRLIAIHYPGDKYDKICTTDNSSIDPEDYSAYPKSIVRRLVKLSQNGGYVCAQYAGYVNSLVGKVEAGTSIQLYHSTWGRNPERIGTTAILKVLPLSNVKEISPDNHAILNSRPRQGSFMRWPAVGDAIQNIVEGHDPQIALSSLHPAQQEIMCSEFLRSPQAQEMGLPRLRYLLTSIGSTMKDIDIIGIADDNSKIMVQVTYHNVETKQAKEKIERLKVYANSSTRLIFFCQANEVQQQGNVTVFPMQKVFDTFGNTPEGKHWLDNAIHSWRNTEG